MEKRAQKPVPEVVTRGQASILARFSLLLVRALSSPHTAVPLYPLPLNIFQKELTDFELLETDVRAKRLPLLASSARAFDEELGRFISTEGSDLLPLVRSAVHAPGSLQVRSRGR